MRKATGATNNPMVNVFQSSTQHNPSLNGNLSTTAVTVQPLSVNDTSMNSNNPRHTSLLFPSINITAQQSTMASNAVSSSSAAAAHAGGGVAISNHSLITLSQPFGASSTTHRWLPNPYQHTSTAAAATSTTSPTIAGNSSSHHIVFAQPTYQNGIHCSNMAGAHHSSGAAANSTRVYRVSAPRISGIATATVAASSLTQNSDLSQQSYRPHQHTYLSPLPPRLPPSNHQYTTNQTVSHAYTSPSTAQIASPHEYTVVAPPLKPPLNHRLPSVSTAAQPSTMANVSHIAVSPMDVSPHEPKGDDEFANKGLCSFPTIKGDGDASPLSGRQKQRFFVVVQPHIRLCIAMDIEQTVGDLLNVIRQRLITKYGQTGKQPQTQQRQRPQRRKKEVLNGITAPHRIDTLYFADMATFPGEAYHILLQNDDKLKYILSVYANIAKFAWLAMPSPAAMLNLPELKPETLRTPPYNLRMKFHTPDQLLYAGFFYHSFTGKKYAHVFDDDDPDKKESSVEKSQSSHTSSKLQSGHSSENEDSASDGGDISMTAPNHTRKRRKLNSSQPSTPAPPATMPPIPGVCQRCGAPRTETGGRHTTINLSSTAAAASSASAVIVTSGAAASLVSSSDTQSEESNKEERYQHFYPFYLPENKKPPKYFTDIVLSMGSDSQSNLFCSNCVDANPDSALTVNATAGAPEVSVTTEWNNHQLQILQSGPDKMDQDRESTNKKFFDMLSTTLLEKTKIDDAVDKWDDGNPNPNLFKPTDTIEGGPFVKNLFLPFGTDVSRKCQKTFAHKYITLLTFVCRCLNGMNLSQVHEKALAQTAMHHGVSQHFFSICIQAARSIHTCEHVRALLFYMRKQTTFYKNFGSIILYDVLVHLSAEGFDDKRYQITKICSRFGRVAGLSLPEVAYVLQMFDTEWQLLKIYRHLF